MEKLDKRAYEKIEMQKLLSSSTYVGSYCLKIHTIARSF